MHIRVFVPSYVFNNTCDGRHIRKVISVIQISVLSLIITQSVLLLMSHCHSQTTSLCAYNSTLLPHQCDHHLGNHGHL